MKTYISEPQQNLIDVALQLHGSAEAVVKLAELNGNLEIGAVLLPGTEILYDETYIVDKKLVEFLSKNVIASE